MTISTESSTFEFTRDWLVSSECFVRDAMLADAVDLDGSREQARLRIHREETDDSPNEDEESASTPDLPAPVHARPRAIVITRGDERRRVGTGTWGGSGTLLVCLEVLIPDAHKIKAADDDAETRASKYAAALEWANQTCNTIRTELEATSGRGDQDGTPYLSAKDINLLVPPGYPEEGENEDYMAWVYEVNWV